MPTNLPKELKIRSRSIADKFFWQFGFDLALSDDKRIRMTRQFETQFDQLRQRIAAAVSRVHSDFDLPKDLVFNVTASFAGSNRNGTSLDDGSDLDVMVQLNPEAATSVTHNIDNNTISFRDHDIQDTVIQELYEAFQRVLDEYQSEQFYISHRSESKALGTFKSCSSSMEFDVLLVLRSTSGDNLVLQADGSVVPSANDAAANQIERFARDYVGVRELVRSLKSVVKRQWQALCPENAPKIASCLFESVVTTVADDMEVSQWKRASFDELWRASLLLIINRLESNRPIAPPNCNTADVLTIELRSDERFVPFLERLATLDKTALKELFESYTAASNVPPIMAATMPHDPIVAVAPASSTTTTTTATATATVATALPTEPTQYCDDQCMRESAVVLLPIAC
jgi:hypothetical protein